MTEWKADEVAEHERARLAGELPPVPTVPLAEPCPCGWNHPPIDGVTRRPAETINDERDRLGLPPVELSGQVEGNHYRAEPRPSAWSRAAGVRIHGPAELPAEHSAEWWRLVATALVARVAGVVTETGTEGGDGTGTVKLSLTEMEAAMGLALIEWPVVSWTADLSVYRAPEAHRYGAPEVRT